MHEVEGRVDVGGYERVLSRLQSLRRMSVGQDTLPLLVLVLSPSSIMML